MLASEILNWTSANGRALVESGESLVGRKDIAMAVDALNLESLSDQALAFLRTALAPIFIVLWMIGLIAITAVPWLLNRIAQINRQ